MRFSSIPWVVTTLLISVGIAVAVAIIWGLLGKATYGQYVLVGGAAFIVSAVFVERRSSTVYDYRDFIAVVDKRSKDSLGHLAAVMALIGIVIALVVHQNTVAWFIVSAALGLVSVFSLSDLFFADRHSKVLEILRGKP